ncbi:MAG TPA: hypothetical protein VHD61_06170 [Lacunisphaera sp.]|nr:hypothetical protein [Lacunisphaera sp.]
MKRLLCLVLVLGIVLACALPAPAAPAKASPPPAKTPGVELAVMASQVTGIAISPLLGVSCIGAWQWWGAHTPAEKAALPWFAQLQFWLPALLLVALCAAKDSLGAMVPPGLKKPLDVAEVFENKVSGLVAAGAVVPSLVALASKFVVQQAGLEPGAALTSGLAMIQLGTLDLSWLLTILMVPLSVAVFAVVWVVAHAINVLILLSPWGGVDAFLKASRTAVLSLVAATAYIDPVVGATLSLGIVVLAWFLAGWAFRLMVFGTVFSWDFLTLKHRRFQLLADGNKLFTARKLPGAPLRTWGRLHQEAEGRLLFKYRPWLVLAERSIEVPREGLVVGKGVFYSEVLGFEKVADKNVTLLLLPPRYRGHEELFARTYHISGTCDVGLRRAWSWLKEALGFGARRAAPAAAAT